MMQERGRNMARKFWKRNEKGELVEFFPNKFNWEEGPINNHINMRTTWSGTTKVEFNAVTMDESIKKMNE